MIGKFIKQPEGFKALIPNKFPPQDLELSPEILFKSTKASLALGKLDGVSHLLPDVDFFIYMYILKDATSSSQIEGTKATMIDALMAKAKIETKLPEDVDDILHYIVALNYGIKRINSLPISSRLIREIHKKLMSGARTSHFSDPGNFRKSQNWIGGLNPSEAEFVPPPALQLNNAMSDLEKFIHAKDNISPLIKAALIHSQFETIHPFLDGNGRTGRMLITFYLWQEKILEKPVLFLSSYFKKNKKVYCDSLNSYHHGKIDKWILFFLNGVIETAQLATKTIKDITDIRQEDQAKISKLGKASSQSAMKVWPLLFGTPIVSVSTVQKWTGFSRPGAKRIIDRFVGLGILELEDKNKKYAKGYKYKRYLDIFLNAFK